jgi:hypothetical protein
MTHAAAATHTLRSPRRRPDGPAAWERAATLALSPVAGLVLANVRTIVRGGDVTFSEEDS